MTSIENDSILVSMIAVWTFLFLLAFPSLCVRFTILHRKLPLRFSVLLSYLTGACQDLFVAFEQLLLFVAFKTLFPFLNPYLFWIFIVLASILQLHILFDAFLHRNSAIRMEISFLSFIDDARCFWDSAKEKKIWRFLPGAFVFLALPVLVYWGYWNHLEALSLRGGWIQDGLILGIIGTLGFLLLPKKLAYATDHIVFQHQMWFLQKLYRFFKRKKDRTDLRFLVRESFTPQNEKRSYPSSEYPLYKHTYGFSGEKTFNLKLENGEKPHVIFLFLESFRSKNVGCLGGEHGVTPHFDRLASEGILFSDFYANSVRTSRSVVASLFGVPSDVDASEQAVRVDAPLVGIPDLMKSAGYKASYIHNGPIHFENQDVFFQNHGYETVLGREDILHKFPKANTTSWGLPDEYLMQYSAQWLKKHDKDPQFLTLFTITNHHPWNLPSHCEPPSLPAELNATYRKYLSTFHYSDASLGLFVDLLEEQGLLEKSILFILGDHGYPMGEHDSNYFEQRYLYDENIRVPLLIYAKGRIAEPKVISSPASQLDLVPTVMDLFKLHGFNHSIGSSLLRKTKDRRVFFHNPYVFRNFGCRINHYKFIYTRLSQEVELYDLEDDPEERRNIARENRMLARECLHHVKDYERLFHRIYAEKSLVPTETYTPEDARSLDYSSDPFLASSTER
ncbi:MAG: sulfatase-like hydrolase/transferase [Simkania sp.]|nr:sulfatase-like hydrolase/transferase [Simkania sp.]MCP5490348.1 sulfatase-like hydrolase/transferase [Chlamydiales bacterium]